jgi:predicted flap endonuclease-1-like 5' DNA nuclease
MWPLCTANCFWWLLLPLLIGLLAGWWAWGWRSHTVTARPEAPLMPEAAPHSPVMPRAAPPAAEPPVAAPVVAAPVAAAAAPVASPAAPMPLFAAAPVTPVAAPVAAVALTALGLPAAVGAPDDLLQLKGVGPKLNTLLITLGVRRFDQIAAWGAAQIATVDDHLGSFRGRVVRDNWVEQAGFLATGNIAAFEAKYGKLDSENG